jgi:hypothetical protein
MTLYIRAVISMKMVSMKMIMINDWSLHNKLKASILIEPANYLVTRFYLMSKNHVGSFYSRLNHEGLF